MRKTQNGTIGQATTEPEDSDDMGVTIGDTHNYNQQPQGSTGGTLAKLAIGAALGASGVGLAAPLGSMLLGRLIDRAPAEAPVDTDTAVITILDTADGILETD